MSTSLRLTLTSMITFIVLFLIIRIAFAVFTRDVPLLNALISMETWVPVLVAGAFYGLIMFFINRRRYPEQ